MRLYLLTQQGSVHGRGIKEESIREGVSRVSTTKRITRANERYLISLGYKLQK